MNQMRSAIIVSTLSLLAASFASAAAQSNEAETLREIAACRAVEKNKARLKCYDKAAELLSAEMSSASGLAAARASAEDFEEEDVDPEAAFGAQQASTADYEEPDVDPEAAFGAEQLVERARERKVEKKDLRALATSISKSRGGKYIIELENGQVWRQIPGDTERLRIVRGEAENREVIIKKRLFGYALRLTDSKRSIRVRRIK